MIVLADKLIESPYIDSVKYDKLKGENKVVLKDSVLTHVKDFSKR